MSKSEVPSYSQFACVGTGFAGIGLGATLKRWYDIGDIQFFERNSKLGGTWFVNQYPGCACDIPSALYSFSFEANPNWSRVMPPQEELWRYLDHVARKYNLTNKMKFGVDVERCEWSEARQRWRMTIRRYSDDSIFTHECQFLFTATGQLMQPNPIDVPGAENFKGAIFHSSRWDTSVDIEGKTVVVFGNGCTATQLIPAIVDKVKHLTQVTRTKHWIMESVDSANTTFMKKVFGSVPGTMRIQRLLMFAWAEDSFRGFYMTDAGTRYRKRVQARVEKYMRATAPEKYHDKIIPDFELGCKRRVFDSGYLKSLHSENMTLMDDPVLEIVPEGIRTKDGIIEADVIVMCNGFVTNNAVGGLKVIGRGGEMIEQHWESFGGAEAYNCTILNNFPNLFVSWRVLHISLFADSGLSGPNSLTGHTSAIIAAENSINFSLRIIKPLLDGKGTIIEVKRDAEEEYVEQMQRDMQDRVWYTGCNSWYLRGSKEGKKWNGSTYPYSQVYFLYRCLFPRFGDLQISGPTHPGRRRSTWRKPAILAFIGYLLSIYLGISRNPLARNRYWQQLRTIMQLLRLMLIMKLRSAWRKVAISAAASTVFLLLSPFRLWKLRQESIKVVPGHRGYVTLIIAVLLALVQLFLGGTRVSLVTEFDIGQFAAIASFFACILLCPLLFLEHSRSVRPSDLAIIYLLVSLACDATEFWLAFESGELYNTDALYMGIPNLALKCVLILAGSRGKASILRNTGEQSSPEEVGGVLSRTFFWWINPILARGNKFVLSGDSLPSLHIELSSEVLRRRALRCWDQRVKPENKITLPRVLVNSLWSHFLAPIIPRLSLIIFRYAQPVLISTVIRYLNSSYVESSQTGYQLILMASIVYIGLAVSSALYFNRLNRLQVMIRGALVGLINSKSLTQQSVGYDDARAITLMSTDAENVGQSARQFHETWAQIIEVLIGTVMLARQVGWACVVPFVMIFFCSRMSKYLAQNLQSKQKDWNEATQKRLAMTTSMLSSMKGLKMLGVTNYAAGLVQHLRKQELHMASRVRWMMVAYNASANALGLFAPIITLMVFVIVASINKKGQYLDTETAFTTTALLGLVTHPSNMIMTIIPQAVGSLAGFQRIQDYLLQPPRSDSRVLLRESDDATTEAAPAIVIERVVIQPNASKPPIVSNVDVEVARGSLVMCSGPVGCGKSALAKALIGEIPISSGTISLSSKRIGYCAQSPWLPGGTFKEAICGFLPEDQSWYEEVIQLCCLKEDLEALSTGDQTMIGSRGLNLSGGQRQRVALARALYARCDIMLLDDSFSALDGKTERQIVDNLIGSEGYFKKAGVTAFIITTSTSYFKLADQLLILGNGSVTYKGTWDDLAQKPGEILKFNNDESHDQSSVQEVKMDKTVLKQKLKVEEGISDLSRAAGDFSLYGYYITAVKLRNFLLLLLCTAGNAFFATFPQYWLQKWTSAPNSETWFYAGGYVLCSFLAWCSTNGSMSSTWLLIAPYSGMELHRRLLGTVIECNSQPLQPRYTVSGSAVATRYSFPDSPQVAAFESLTLAPTNRFTRDLQIDSANGSAVQRAEDDDTGIPTCCGGHLHRAAGLLAYIETLDGLATIRAFGWEKQVENANIRSLDKSQKPAYILFCLQRWLCIVLDLIVAAIATSLIAFAVLMKGTTTAGQIGMALNLVLVVNSTLLSFVSAFTNLEVSLGAISRLKNLAEQTPKEDKPGEDYVPKLPWPSDGVVEINNMTVAYNSEAVALQNVTIKVSGGQQLIICGRTGSGKSTLLLALLRLLDASSGSIKVDGVDLSLVPRSLIREDCFITVCQDPFILDQTSLRFNLNPISMVGWRGLADVLIIDVLQRTGLWSHFKSGESDITPSEAKEILDTPMSSLPQMSTGQTQLFALSRAILQKAMEGTEAYVMGGRHPGKKILLLDEATASLDPETEAAMGRIIHEEFTAQGHTVMAISHRLGGLAENMREGQDAVALLSNGRIEKIGSVHEVLGTMVLEI
ncbi:ABC transporter FUM19 [Colletotrichum gloeosporioides]|uniref:ABC transporter FUM19 n=1 Tax=Colletotrichum gloeosporioides TaxID=474922 RepID=A0A8H4FMN1_COLGL|nr:ABC transporter FUM19 [Colletotrichum gloeosporioides]KAF3807888.1 ABC transporter FUM19 [Colletotrichum gloeosporioides]